MPRTCKVCGHPERQSIEESLLKGEPIRSIERRYRVSDSSLVRHNREHLLPEVRAVHQMEQRLSSGTLLERLYSQVNTLPPLCAEVGEVLATAKAARNPELTLKAVRELTVLHREIRGTLELIGRVTGELNTPNEADRPQVIVFLSSPTGIEREGMSSPGVIDAP